MFFKAVYHIWKSDFSVLGYRGLKSLIPDGPSFLWSSRSQAGWGILHWEKKSWSLIRYCPRKVYRTILHCRLWRISRNALTRVIDYLKEMPITDCLTMMLSHIIVSIHHHSSVFVLIHHSSDKSEWWHIDVDVILQINLCNGCQSPPPVSTMLSFFTKTIS